MENHPANDNYQKTLSFSPCGAGMCVGDVPFFKKMILRLFLKSSRQIMPSSKTIHREATARSIFKCNAASPYEVDDFGQPRILSRWEVILYALAWPAVIGVVIGFGVAIALLVIHNSSRLEPQESASQSQVGLQEEAS